jgi:RNA polymerase sigma-54 factor
MKLSLNNNMRMEQRMKLAPRMIQSMEVLQLPLLALQEKIETELNSNPVLELDDEQPVAPIEITPTETAETSEEQELVVRDDSDKVEDFQRLENVSDEFENYFEGYSYRPVRNDGEPDRKMEAMQNTAAGEISLNDSLRDQWRLVEAPEPVKAAGDLIIDYIDEKGYVTVRIEQLHNKDKYPFGLDQLNQALRLIQKMEPVGVGARDPRECLLLQMEQFPEDMSFETELIRNHWNDLLENHLPQIAKKMNVSIERIGKAIERMSKLDISPGLSVGRNENHPITADVVVESDGRGGYHVFSAETRVPSLRVNQFYQKMARNRSIDENTRQFLQKNIRSAQWFMDAIEQRKQTLLRVARAVVDYQKDFFDKGKLYLKPLPMAVIAKKVGVHIATISRAVSGKYMQCPQGILPLRGFFSGGTEDDQGRELSYDAVKARLQEIVDAEDKSKPLGDDELRIKLAEAGMGNIARRTVAKYRSILNIPTARFRKKY